MNTIDTTCHIHVYFNDEYPKGYTTATKRSEAMQLAQVLVETTKKTWGVVSGSNHWKTGKPCYWIVYAEQD